MKIQKTEGGKLSLKITKKTITYINSNTESQQDMPSSIGDCDK